MVIFVFHLLELLKESNVLFYCVKAICTHSPLHIPLNLLFNMAESGAQCDLEFSIHTKMQGKAISIRLNMRCECHIVVYFPMRMHFPVLLVSINLILFVWSLP